MICELQKKPAVDNVNGVTFVTRKHMSPQGPILDSSQRPQTFYKKKCVRPTVFCDVDRMLQRVQCIVQVRRVNSSRSSISQTKQNRQFFNSIRHSPPGEMENSANIDQFLNIDNLPEGGFHVKIVLKIISGNVLVSFTEACTEGSGHFHLRPGKE